MRTPNSELRTPNSGFTLIELLMVIGIVSLLTGIVTFNFAALRVQQETQAAAADLVSRLRELQTAVSAGREVAADVAPDAYLITFQQGADDYRIDYVADSATTTLETVNLTQNITINALRVGGTGVNLSEVRLTAPFAKIFIDNAADQNLEIDLRHRSGQLTRTVIVDGLSGRIGVE